MKYRLKCQISPLVKYR